MKEEKRKIEELLQQGQTVQIAPQGYSMYPMLMPGRDQAILKRAEPEKLKKGDVVLYRRPGSILVLHRLCKHSSAGFFMVGDNQIEVEGPLSQEQILGVLTAFIRKGHHISVKNPVYVVCVRIWLFLRPVRRPFQLAAAFVKRIVRKIGGLFRRKKQH